MKALTLMPHRIAHIDTAAGVSSAGLVATSYGADAMAIVPLLVGVLTAGWLVVRWIDFARARFGRVAWFPDLRGPDPSERMTEKEPDA